MDTFKDGTNMITNFFNNKYVTGIIIVVAVLYASLIRPDLPDNITKLFDYPIVKIIMYVLIILLMTQNLQVAMVVAIGFYVVMNILSTYNITETFITKQQEKSSFIEVQS